MLCVGVVRPGPAEGTLYTDQGANGVITKELCATTAFNVATIRVNIQAVIRCPVDDFARITLRGLVARVADSRRLAGIQQRVGAGDEERAALTKVTARRNLRLGCRTGRHDLGVGRRVRINRVGEEAAGRPTFFGNLIEVQRAVVKFVRRREGTKLPRLLIDGIDE